jgi:tRNA (guanine6-N2)-methyltransferase
MVKTYASTFTSGLQALVPAMLAQALPDAKVEQLLDGLVLYRTAATPKTLDALRFVNNSFEVLRTFDQLGRHPMQALASRVAQDKGVRASVHQSLTPAEGGKGFRLIASDENRFVSMNGRLRQTIESQISGVKGLRVNRAKPDLEFWLLHRSEGLGLFMKRLSSHTAYEEVLDKGELRPELAYALTFLSEPDAEDIVLDPFCGSGAIPFERDRAFPYNMIFAADQDPEQIRAIRQKLKTTRTRDTFIAKRQDALDMVGFEDGFIHKIVTDPPWGYYQEIPGAVEDFYRRMLREFTRVLRPGGLMVILTAQKDVMTAAAAAMKAKLDLVASYDILVSGKKAAIYKLKTTVNRKV